MCIFALLVSNKNVFLNYFQPKNKKKFIDKKNAVTFHLVHRSQRDPLIADENAPKRVLDPVVKLLKADREKYGIYFDDNYDYMQHLKPIDGKGELIQVAQQTSQKFQKHTKKIVLPSSVFKSNVEEDVGLLNRVSHGFQPDLDEDVVDVLTAMEEDFDFSDPENELDDNFIKLANGQVDGEEESEEECDEDDDGYSGEEDDEVNSIDMVETKSRFTEYSMTSSVIRRNEQLTLLDDRFEEIFAEYSDNEIGALECEDIEGPMDDKTVIFRLGLKDEKEEKLDKESVINQEIPAFSCSSDSEDSVIVIPEKSKWDCESILSTYSNLYNHPKVIDAPPSKIRIDRKTGIPITSTRLTASALSKLDGSAERKPTGPGSLVSQVSALSIRPKNETPADRKTRKDIFKKYKKERRVEKKLNTTAFKEEKKRMEKMMANNKSKFLVHI
ncbi:hypothetical protein AAG570_006243 [Ranatra chinensis]|uniref:Protein LTV1 homolog n=1 Tax=Ranatra chinensis TaxID=642074 RepID=A0ABD0Z408_9HEMI